MRDTDLKELGKAWASLAARARHDREALATQREALTTPEARKRFTQQYIGEQERGLASQAGERWHTKAREAAAWRDRLRGLYQDEATRRRRYFRHASLAPDPEAEIAAIIQSQKICTDSDAAIIRGQCDILNYLMRMDMRHELQLTPLSELVALAETAPSDGERGAAMVRMIQQEMARRPVPSGDDKDAWSAFHVARKKIEAAADAIPLPAADQAELELVNDIVRNCEVVAMAVEAMTDQAAAARLDTQEKVRAVRENGAQAFIDGVAARQQQHTARVKEAVTDLTRGAVLKQLDEINAQGGE